MVAFLTMVWAALNSPVGIAAMVGALAWFLTWVYSKKPELKPLWEKYKGTIITAIELAEKQIPDDTQNKAAAKLDAALRYVLKIHREMEKRSATAEELAVLREGIQIVQANLKANGVIPTNGSQATG